MVSSIKLRIEQLQPSSVINSSCKALVITHGARVNILIISTITAQQPEAPSHLVSGLSNDTVHFKVLQPPYPPAAVLNHLLAEECSDWSLTTYDQGTGIGAFISIDLEGPDEGAEFNLSSTTPIRQASFVIQRHQTETMQALTYNKILEEAAAPR